MDRTDASNSPNQSPPTPAGPAARPPIRLTGTEQSEHDALAELFLGDAAFAPAPMDAGSVRTPRPAPPPAPHRFDGSAARAARPADEPQPGRDTERAIVELVILGHLPVRASLWVRQYACLSARKRNETVSLVRSAGGSVSIDVIADHQPVQVEPVGSLEDAVTIATHAAPRVILRVDETAEPELLDQDGIDEVTILTGADEAAVVASYRLIKTLMATLDDRLDPDAAPRVRVAVMGNPGPQNDAARQKIARACKAFLDRPVEILDASGRIDATGTVTVCRSDEPGAADEVLGRLLGDHAGRGFHPAAADRANEAAHLRLAVDAVAPAPVPEVVIPIAERRAEPVADSVIEAKPLRMREPLARLIEGLSPIEARCPLAPDVELACDRDGRLHAVSTDDRGAGEAVAALLAVSAWARANLPLLIRAESGVAMPSCDPADPSEASLHLLARRPGLARGVLDTEVTVYALASVRAGGEEVMIATPLNDC